LKLEFAKPLRCKDTRIALGLSWPEIFSVNTNDAGKSAETSLVREGDLGAEIPRA